MTAARLLSYNINGMQIKHEIRYYGKNEKVWVGKYGNSQNSAHWHYDCELVYSERGNFVIMCDKQTYELRCGQAFFIDSEQLHYIRAEKKDCILATIFFTNDVIKHFSGGKILASPLLAHKYDINGLYTRLKDILLQKREFYEAESALETARVMLEIFRGEETLSRPKQKRATEKFKSLLDKMTENTEFFTFEGAADFMGMNEAYFSRFFHNVAGVTFSQYLNRIRVTKAVNLLSLSNGAQITDIASACGFSTIRNFNRVFKEVTGFSPKNLPRDYVNDVAYFPHTGAHGNPTFTECEILECSSYAPQR